jgi:hypothetical protein
MGSIQMSIAVFGYAIKFVYMIPVSLAFELRHGTLNFPFVGWNLCKTVVAEEDLRFSRR